MVENGNLEPHCSLTSFLMLEHKLCKKFQKTCQIVAGISPKLAVMHNGGNDSLKRQSQLWDQITCLTKTG